MSPKRQKSPAAPWAEPGEVLLALDRASASGQHTEVLSLVRGILDALSSESNLDADLRRAAAKGAGSFERLKGPALGVLGLRIVALNRVVYPGLLRCVEQIAQGEYASAIADLAAAARGLAHIVQHSDIRYLVDGARRARMAGGNLRRHRTVKDWQKIDPILQGVLSEHAGRPRTFQRDAALRRIEEAAISTPPGAEAVYRRLGRLAREEI